MVRLHNCRLIFKIYFCNFRNNGTEIWNQSMEQREFKYLQMKVLPSTVTLVYITRSHPSNVGKHGKVSSDVSFAVECGQARRSIYRWMFCHRMWARMESISNVIRFVNLVDLDYSSLGAISLIL